MANGYLCTKRFQGQRIFVGPTEIVISHVKGKEVYLAIRAPKDLEIVKPSAAQDRMDKLSQKEKIQ